MNEFLMTEPTAKLQDSARLCGVVLAGLGSATDERRASHRRFYATELEAVRAELTRRGVS